VDRDEARNVISKWFSEASDDIDTDRLETMLREVHAEVESGVSCVGALNTFIQSLELEIEARRRGEAERKAGETRSAREPGR